MIRAISPAIIMNTTEIKYSPEAIMTEFAPYVKDLIQRIKKTYKSDVVISSRLINEIDNMYRLVAGCAFADWLNHRLYADILAKNTPDGEDTPIYVDFEELEELEEPEPEEEDPELMSDGIDTRPEEEAYATDCIIQELPTYEKVIENMENFIKDLSKDRMTAGAVFGWLSEYSRRNHARMVVIASKLCAIKEDYYHEDFDVREEIKKEIFNIGCDIDREGGFQAQQACFYVAVNFIAPTNKRLKAIEICWGGAGSWRN